jgi:hypothetical protein
VRRAGAWAALLAIFTLSCSRTDPPAKPASKAAPAQIVAQPAKVAQKEGLLRPDGVVVAWDTIFPDSEGDEEEEADAGDGGKKSVGDLHREGKPQTAKALERAGYVRRICVTPGVGGGVEPCWVDERHFTQFFAGRTPLIWLEFGELDVPDACLSSAGTYVGGRRCPAADRVKVKRPTLAQMRDDRAFPIPFDEEIGFPGTFQTPARDIPGGAETIQDLLRLAAEKDPDECSWDPDSADDGNDSTAFVCAVFRRGLLDGQQVIMQCHRRIVAGIAGVEKDCIPLATMEEDGWLLETLAYQENLPSGGADPFFCTIRGARLDRPLVQQLVKSLGVGIIPTPMRLGRAVGGEVLRGEVLNLGLEKVKASPPFGYVDLTAVITSSSGDVNLTMTVEVLVSYRRMGVREEGKPARMETMTNIVDELRGRVARNVEAAFRGRFKVDCSGVP